jgi:hypothetical protein
VSRLKVDYEVPGLAGSRAGLLKSEKVLTESVEKLCRIWLNLRKKRLK